MKRIGFLLGSSGWGGLEMNVLHLAGWLIESKWDLIFFAEKDTKVALEAEAMNIKVVYLKHKKYADLVQAYRFSKLLNRNSVSTLMIFNNRDIDFTFWTKHLFMKKLYVLFQQHMQIGLKKRDLIHTIRYSSINCWIAPLQFLKKEVLENTRISPSAIEIIPLGVEISRFYPPQISKVEARKKLGIDYKGTLLGILGRIDQKKGQLFLVKALLKLQEEGINLQLLIMGETTQNDVNAISYLEEINNFIRKNSLKEKIYFRNFSKEVQQFYQAIDFFAMASESETYGMVTIEALLSGVPVLGTNSGGTREILGDGDYGNLYNFDDLSDFCKNIKNMMRAQESTKATSIKGQDWARKTFAHDRECMLLSRLFK